MIQDSYHFALLRDIPRGEYFKRTATATAVYIRGEYVRGKDYRGYTLNKYSCMDTEDMNRELFLKGSAVVVVGFTY